MASTRNQLARVADERQALKVARTVEPAIALRAAWDWQQPDLFVVANGRNLDAALPGGGAMGTSRVI